MSVPWEERPRSGEEVVPLALLAEPDFCWYLVGLFPFSAVGLVMTKPLICVILEWVWGWLMSRLDGSLLPAALSTWWTARYLQTPAKPSACTQNFLLKLLSQKSACFGGLDFPWILIKSNGKALLHQLCIFLHTRLASHAFYTHATMIKACHVLLRKYLIAWR